jgi:hypothetical protein
MKCSFKQLFFNVALEERGYSGVVAFWNVKPISISLVFWRKVLPTASGVKHVASNKSVAKQLLKNGVFWDVTPFGSCKNRLFGGT